MGIWVPAIVAAITLIGTIGTAVLANGSGRSRAEVEMLKELVAIRRGDKDGPIESELLEAEKRLLRKISDRYRRPGTAESVLSVILFAGGFVALLFTGLAVYAGLQNDTSSAAGWTICAFVLAAVAVAAGFIAIAIRDRGSAEQPPANSGAPAS